MGLFISYSGLSDVQISILEMYDNRPTNQHIISLIRM